MDQESLNEEYRKFREEFDPRDKRKDISILFIAESPPEPKSKENLDYFYSKNSQQRKGALWWHFNQAIYDGAMHEKEKFLRRFQDDGYFLIDVFSTKQELIDIRNEVKLEKYTNAVKVSRKLFDRIHELNPEQVVFLGKGTAKLIAGSLPFRSKDNERRFKKFVRASLRVEL